MSYIFAWHRGSFSRRGLDCYRYETVNGLATNVPLHYPELSWSGCLYDLNIGIETKSKEYFWYIGANRIPKYAFLEKLGSWSCKRLVACASYWRPLTGTAPVSRENVAQNTHRQSVYEQVGDTIVDGWPQFECNLMFLPIWFCHTAAIASTLQPVPEPINGVTATWLSCFATCDWLRALAHLHFDVIITTPTTKTWWFCRSLGVDLPCLRKKIYHQNTM